MRLLPCLAAALLAAACASTPSTRSPQDPVAALLLGEQHDAPEHQQLHRQVVEQLADRGLLAALVLEMALQGRSTAAVPRDAGEQQVREALAWNEQAWPWAAYGPAVMAAVRAGVPVLGSNLDMAAMRAAMNDAAVDALLPADALREQHDAIRSGHCGLLPEARVPAMARVQVARDAAMARVIRQAAAPGKTVVLLAGSGHVDPRLGVPVHLRTHITAQAEILPRVETGRDYCAELRRQMPASGSPRP